MRDEDTDGSVLVFLGSFPYAGLEPCRFRGCGCASERAVAFMHGRLRVLLLCRAHAELAVAWSEHQVSVPRMFSRPLTDGDRGSTQNYVHPLHGRVHERVRRSLPSPQT